MLTPAIVSNGLESCAWLILSKTLPGEAGENYQLRLRVFCDLDLAGINTMDKLKVCIAIDGIHWRNKELEEYETEYLEKNSIAPAKFLDMLIDNIGSAMEF